MDIHQRTEVRQSQGGGITVRQLRDIPHGGGTKHRPRLGTKRSLPAAPQLEAVTLRGGKLREYLGHRLGEPAGEERQQQRRDEPHDADSQTAQCAFDRTHLYGSCRTDAV